MTHQDAAVARYLVIQAVLSAAIALTLGLAILSQDVAGLRTLVRTPADALIFLVGSVMSLFPIVFATSVGVLSYDNDA
jgi:hypothetical protein